MTRYDERALIYVLTFTARVCMCLALEANDREDLESRNIASKEPI